MTDSREHVPEIRQMISSGKDIIDEPQAMLRTEPTGQNMQIISPTEAKRALGKFAKRIEGTSVRLHPLYTTSISQRLTQLALTVCCIRFTSM